MCDGTLSDLSTADKLELLTAHADAWKNLDTACPEKVDILVGWGPPIAVSCNVMVFSRRSSQPENHRGKRNDVDAEVMALVGPRFNLLVLRVPSVLRRVEAAHWVLDLPGNVAAEVCIDASQDLLIYQSYVLFRLCIIFSLIMKPIMCARLPFLGVLLSRDGIFYPCMLSSGSSHPLAEHGGYFHMWHGDRCPDVFNLCIYGDFVAVVSRVYFITVWNWKTGQLVSDQVRISN